MADSRPDPKSSAPYEPRRQSQRACVRRDRAPDETGLHDPRAMLERGDSRHYTLESDLSDDRVARDHELRAIERLLGDELEGILSGQLS